MRRTLKASMKKIIFFSPFVQVSSFLLSNELGIGAIFKVKKRDLEKIGTVARKAKTNLNRFYSQNLHLRGSILLLYPTLPSIGLSPMVFPSTLPCNGLKSCSRGGGHTTHLNQAPASPENPPHGVRWPPVYTTPMKILRLHISNEVKACGHGLSHQTVVCTIRWG